MYIDIELSKAAVRKILLAKYPNAEYPEEKPAMAFPEASLPRNPLKPQRVGPIITPETQAKLDKLEAAKAQVAQLTKAQAETKKQLDALATRIATLKKKMGIKKRSPEAEAAYQSNLPMFRRLGVLA
ncbi:MULTISPECIES: hypothetical protein [Pseudomonadaceae]|uniref:hypothetical protein n=1 Tax=Pseudomonadaceae TaxID=135621 RepID=UPI001112D459|nr:MULTISPECIES: hypothetical protein [Pseudomonas]